MAVQDFDTATSYKLTDDDIERAHLLIGREVPNKNHEAHSSTSYDAIRLSARSIGDDNPLYCDEHYGKSTRWGSQIAPGFTVRNINSPLLGDPLPPEIYTRTRGIFRGVHEFMSGSTWQWFRPVVPGERLYSFSYVADVAVKKSSFADRTVLMTRTEVKFNSDADVVAQRSWVMIHSERKAAAKKGKYSNIEFTPYTQEQVDEIDAGYAAEVRRGADPRYWEDVEVGDSLGHMLKGPLTVGEIIMFHAGGFGLDPFLSSSRMAYQNRLRFPAFYIANADGFPEVGQRVHWDSEWAQAIGNPRAYDYGFMRQCWLFHFLSDWCGDDGFVVGQHDQIRRFNYVGDLTRLTGEVVGKERRDDGLPVVDVAVTGVNQRGEQNIVGGGTIALPSREHGAFTLPRAPEELRNRAAYMWDRHLDLSKGQP